MSVRVILSKTVEVEEVDCKTRQSSMVTVSPKYPLHNVRVLWEDDEVLVIRLPNGNKLNNIPKDAVESIVW